MASRKQRRDTRKLKKDTQAVLKEKLAEMILLREEIEMQENFAADLAEKKAVIQQQINVSHQIQALKVVIGLFSEGE
jgi:predicted flavoprotein YhiN